MKMIAAALFAVTSATGPVTQPAQDRYEAEMSSHYGAQDAELQSILYFEDIGLEKLQFTGPHLKGSDYIISIEDYADGALSARTDIFDSREDPYFKVRGNELAFRVLSRTDAGKSVKFQFQFNGFAKRVTYDLRPHEEAFALKNFLGARTSIPVDLKAENVALTYMMPYVEKDGSKQYCDVVQSGVPPESLGKKYRIPRYFLIKIRFAPANG